MIFECHICGSEDPSHYTGYYTTAIQMNDRISRKSFTSQGHVQLMLKILLPIEIAVPVISRIAEINPYPKSAIIQ